MNSRIPAFEQQQPPRSRKAAFLIVALAFLCLGNAYLWMRLNRLQVQSHTLEQTVGAEIAKVSESTSLQTGHTKRDLQTLRAQIETALEDTAKKAKAEARKETGWLARTVSEKQREQQEQLAGAIREIGGKAEQVEIEVQKVNEDLTGVKEEVTQTKSQIDDTHAAIRHTAEQVGTINEKIAENHSAISALRQQGEHRQIAFRLPKSKQMQKVGDIQLRLRRADAKRNKYTLEVLADDVKVVKKGKHVNEPVQFYVYGVPQPYEIVVTQVTKDGVTGYLAVPGARTARGSSGA